MDAKMAVSLGNSLSWFKHKRKWEDCGWKIEVMGWEVT